MCPLSALRACLLGCWTTRSCYLHPVLLLNCALVFDDDLVLRFACVLGGLLGGLLACLPAITTSPTIIPWSIDPFIHLLGAHSSQRRFLPANRPPSAHSCWKPRCVRALPEVPIDSGYPSPAQAKLTQLQTRADSLSSLKKRD